MEPLQVSNKNYQRSVSFDAANKDGTVVTVGVETTRREEAKLLNLCCDRQASQYEPFATKSRDLELDTVPIKQLMRDSPGRVAVALCSENPDNFVRAEAAQSAVLYDGLTPFESTTVAIADGDKRHAELLGKGLKALGNEGKTVVACQRSELYYPQSYFADLLAGTIVRRPDLAAESLLGSFDFTTGVDTDRGLFWKAYNNIGAGRYDYQVPDYKKQVGHEPATRAISWFNGAFASNTGNRPVTDSTHRIETWLNNNDYDAIADQI